MYSKGNLSNILKQAKQMQKKLEAAQEELEKLEVEGQAGGGMVVVKANGKQELVSIKIDPEILDEDIEMIEDLILAAVNQAMAKASEESQNKLGAISGGVLGDLKIPGA